MCRVRRQEIVNFMTPPPPPKGDVILELKCKIDVFLQKSYSLLRGMFFGQNKCIVMMNKKASTQIVYVMTPGVVVLGKWIWPYKI